MRAAAIFATEQGTVLVDPLTKGDLPSYFTRTTHIYSSYQQKHLQASTIASLNVFI